MTVAGRGYRFVGQVSDAPSADASSYIPAPAAPSIAPRARTLRTGGWTLAAALVVLALSVGAGLWWWERPPDALIGQRTGIVLADPQDFTGEGGLDHVISQVLRADFSQSPMFQVASDTEIAETLALMEQPQNASLTRRGRRQSARATTGGRRQRAVSKIQKRYVLTLAAVSCADGRVLVDEKAEAHNKEAVVRHCRFSRRACAESWVKCVPPSLATTCPWRPNEPALLRRFGPIQRLRR